MELELRAEMLAQLGSRPPAVLPINARLTSEPVAALDVRMQGSRLRRGHTTCAPCWGCGDGSHAGLFLHRQL